MFNKIFEKMAEKQLTTVTPLNRLSNAMFDHHCNKIGAVKILSDGSKGIDMVKVRASGLKREALYFGVVIPAAAIIGNVLGKHQ